MQAAQEKVVLFLSVDLAGSTAHKSRSLEQGGRPLWLSTYEQFFREMPLILMGCVARVFIDEESIPNVGPWKVAGDEIIFSCVPTSGRDCGLLARAFCDAVASYETRLLAEELGLHGCVWGAKLPTRNIELEIPEMSTGGGAESVFRDYLGPDVDLGFRLAKHAAPGEVVVALSVAETIATITPPTLLLTLKGETPLHGFFGATAYPLVLARRTESSAVGRAHPLSEAELLRVSDAFHEKIGYPSRAESPFRLF